MVYKGPNLLRDTKRLVYSGFQTPYESSVFFDDFFRIQPMHLIVDHKHIE